jgi:antitoxin PrlF
MNTVQRATEAKPETAPRLVAKVGERGQVTIPKALRTRYGLKPGMEVEFVATNGGVTIRRSESLRERILSLVGTVDLGMSTDEFIEEIRGR